MEEIKDIKNTYKKIEKEINKAKKGYKKAFKYSNEDFFGEVCFCLLTPQSKALNAWSAIKTLKENRLLFNGEASEISEYLNIVRFKNNKAKYIVELREKMTYNGVLNPKKFFDDFGYDDIVMLRNYIAKNIKGMGLKEASHVLRNLGFGQNIAILDRHILKNLVKFSVIDEIPTLTEKNYHEIEEKMRKFSKKIDIDMESLDLIFWYNEAGEVFK